MTQSPLIIGAGFTGLLAAHAWPTAQIIEAAPTPKQTHKALMRFRTDAVSVLTGIEFRKVMVRKGIFYHGQFAPPSISIANLYARKVVGRVVDRSIWNLDPVERFIAPEDFYDQLVDAVQWRIRFNQPYIAGAMVNEDGIINTAPLPVILQAHELAPDIMQHVQCRKSPIGVRRWRVHGADVFQTVYFPDPELAIYRISITKDLLIAEEMRHEDGRGYQQDAEVVNNLIQQAFGITPDQLEFIDATHQSYGKVDELPPALRKQVLFELTAKHRIYSLGRFATWRNILLDDVVQDINVIKRLLKTRGAYDASKVAAQ